ncbi:glycosyltransferase family 4 protein [Carbonactinospora thermoautotrophica]|uniref:glycosyltransferase family 4 protein n=1 Tax=Carbonactinospora thermoautotrophica TaxID=1469144 RepID=UPI000833E1AD|nr:glycosyltransferase family 4 protein [Carbonactinospora thermoautotrophica]
MRIVMVLDTPNIWAGVPVAGTPARMAQLARALSGAGADVVFVLCDRGITATALAAWPFNGLLVHPEVLYGPPPLLAEHLRPYAPDLLVVTDAEAVATNARAWADLLGCRLVYEAHDDEAALSRSLGEPAALTARRRAWQEAAARAADYVTVLSAREAATMRGYGVDPARLLVAPNGVDLSARTPWGPNPPARRLLFIGNLHYAPNARAVQLLVELVAALRERGVEVSARVVGRGPGDVTRPAAGVEFRGPVVDLDPELADVTVAVAPLVAGSGMKMKVLDYLAAGLPVLATSEAVNGLPPDSPGVIVCDELDRWPGLVAELLDDPARLQTLGAAGRARLRPDHEWAGIAARVLAAYRSWLALPAPPRPPAALPPGAGEPRWLVEHAQQQALKTPALTTAQPVIHLPAGIPHPA